MSVQVEDWAAGELDAGHMLLPTVPSVCVVVPTRNEAGNVRQLVQRLAVAMPGTGTEVLFVDDSDDETPTRVLEVAAETDLPVHLFHRAPEARADGLGGAVLAGLRQTQADLVVVMDGDLQHPPEVVPQLVAAALLEEADVVVASRYCPSGDATGLSSRARTHVSSSATTLVRAVFPVTLRSTTDPMSGFFVVRRTALPLDTLRPLGFKILLEILVRSGGLRITERPFTFCTRGAGESKAGLREGWRFLRQVARLRLDAGTGRQAAASPARTAPVLLSRPAL